MLSEGRAVNVAASDYTLPDRNAVRLYLTRPPLRMLPRCTERRVHGVAANAGESWWENMGNRRELGGLCFITRCLRCSGLPERFYT